MGAKSKFQIKDFVKTNTITGISYGYIIDYHPKSNCYRVENVFTGHCPWIPTRCIKIANSFEQVLYGD